MEERRDALSIARIRRAATIFFAPNFTRHTRTWRRPPAVYNGRYMCGAFGGGMIGGDCHNRAVLRVKGRLLPPTAPPQRHVTRVRPPQIHTAAPRSHNFRGNHDPHTQYVGFRPKSAPSVRDGHVRLLASLGPG